MSLVIPGPPPRVPPLEPDPAGASSVADGLRAASTAQDVAEWARSHGAPEDWSGEASEAADHALTALAGNLDAAVAAMRRVNTALTEFYDEVGTLDQRRTDLVEEHSSLTMRQALLAAHSASYVETEEADLRERARSLTGDIDTFVAAIETWQRDVATAEDAVIAVLEASDTPSEAHRYADAGAEDVDELIADLIDQGVFPPGATTASPEEMRRWLAGNPAAAQTLMDRVPSAAHGDLGGQLAAALGRAGDDPSAMRNFFDRLPPTDAATLAMLYPGLLGNQSGVPFAYRADANQVAVSAALGAEERALLGLQDDQARLFAGEPDMGAVVGSQNEIADAERRLDLYRSILEGDRQILYFDPTGDGSIAELHGEIGDSTRNLGIFVPGATADLAGFEATARRAQSFADAPLDNNLAMVSWLGGDMPDSVFPLSSDPGYSQDLAPDLADFSHQVRSEIDHSAAAANGVQTTVLGHSYGGAAVGLSETHGLDADRVLHVGSAGMGRDVYEPSDLPSSQDGVDRYSMTAPADSIGHTQGHQAAGLGHGADPDTFDGTTRLDTGDDDPLGDAGDPTYGGDPHSGIFERGSDAWNNMLAVLTGEEAVGYRFPNYEPYDSDQNGWGEPGERIDVP